MLDFGLAKLVEPPTSSENVSNEDPTILQHSTPGLILGTMGYMSPEQAQGKTKEIDHRSDIFSFGCILFEAITSKKAFSGKDQIETLNKVIREPAPLLSAINPNAPAELQRIVRRCLAKDPDERYQSIKDAVESNAVIPFVNQSKDVNSEWISDGLTESIINNLTQLPNLKVISRSSVFRYKGKESDPIAVGKELGVRAVLTGRLMQRGESMLISTELIDIRDNKQLWGEQYERRLADMLSVQREIAREITNNLRPTLSGMEQSRADKQYTASAEAYQLYLKGRYYWNKRTPADFRKAIPFFQQAIEKDPDYAMAYSGLADTYSLVAAYSDERPKEWMPKAKEAALKALALDDKLAEAHASLGQIAVYYDYDSPTGDREFRRALELNPNYPTAHQWMADNLSHLKRFDEAIAEIRRALELDPLSPIINKGYGDILVDAERFDEGIAQYQKTIELDPNFSTTYLFLARAYEGKGMYDQAVEAYNKFAAFNMVPEESLNEAKEIYRKSGWKAYWRTSVDRLVTQSQGGSFYRAPFVVATIYARAGQHDEAIKWLEKAYEERSGRMAWIGVSFEFGELRSDPRFKDLVRRVGVPE